MTASPVQLTSVRDEALAILCRLGTSQSAFAREGLAVSSPITGELIAQVRVIHPKEAGAVIGRAAQAFDVWRTVPAPRRGELVRILADELRAAKDDLGQLVTIETGKIVSEGLGEVQEMIDICDFAVGLSRQLYGRTIATERVAHRMMEIWHPLGVCGIISAFIPSGTCQCGVAPALSWCARSGSAATTPANQNSSTSTVRWRTSSRQFQPDGSTGRRKSSSERPSRMPRTCARWRPRASVRAWSSALRS